MSLTYRYLVQNKIQLVANNTGFITEYRPVYQRTINVYKGIDNTLDFRLLNADQKPIDLTTTSDIVFTLFDDEQQQIARKLCTVVDALKGTFKVVLSENELLNVKQQYLSYNIYLVDANGTPDLTYTDAHFGNNGVIFVSADAFPAPLMSHEITSFNQEGGLDSTLYYATNLISGQPEINGNEALHTAVIYPNGFTGTLTLEATLTNDISTPDQINWAQVATIEMTDAISPVPLNFYGVFNYLRFVTLTDPTDTITKIVIRN